MMHGERLLLVEDDAATRELLTLLLEGQGWTVEAVESGEDALQALRAGTPALALCDLHLPGVCGPALALALRAGAPEAVLLAMSATARANAGEGYDGAVLKPFAPEAIEAGWKSTVAHRLEDRVALERAPALEAAFLDQASAHRGVRPEAAHDGPILDEATLEQLRQGMGDAGMRRFYAFALGDAGDRMDRMEAAAQAGDGAVFAREAHALKGSSGMMGARQVWRLAANAEMEGLERDGMEKVLRLRVATGAVRLMLETLFPV